VCASGTASLPVAVRHHLFPLYVLGLQNTVFPNTWTRGALNGNRIVIIGGTTGTAFPPRGLSSEKTGRAVIIVGPHPETRRPHSNRSTSPRSLLLALTRSQNRDETIELALKKSRIFTALITSPGGRGRRWVTGTLARTHERGWHATIDLNLTSLIFSKPPPPFANPVSTHGAATLLTCPAFRLVSVQNIFATHAYCCGQNPLSSALPNRSLPITRRTLFAANVIAPALVRHRWRYARATQKILSSFKNQTASR